jgi:hypothetical protein
MYELLIKAYVEYFRQHPQDRQGLAFVEADPALGPLACLAEDVGARWVAWLETDAAWTPPLVAWRLGQDMQQLDEVSPEEQRQFQVALRQALAQLDRGAEER